MDVYFIVISDIPKDKVHPSFRYMEEYEEPETYSLFLSIRGRLTNKHSNRANLDSYELATKLLEYWEPRLATRGWGNYQSAIRCEKADKWREKKVSKNVEETLAFLEEHQDSVVRKQSKSQGNMVIFVQGIKPDNAPFKEGYWSRHKKHGWVVSSDITHAQRYKTRTYCQTIIANKFSGSKFSVSIKTLSQEELTYIETQKKQHWDSVFCKFK